MIGLYYMIAATGVTLISLVYAQKQERANIELQAENDRLVLQLPVRVGGSSDVCKDPDWDLFEKL